MKIDGLKPYTPRKLKKVKSSGANDLTFPVSMAEDDCRRHEANMAQMQAESASLSSLMQVQEIQSEHAPKAQAIAKGESLLQSLEELQNSILLGQIPQASLKQIAALTQMLPSQVGDSNIKGILAEIKQRALVELAKIEMSEA